MQALPEDHWISVSRGPPTDALDALGGFKRTFSTPRMPKHEIADEIARPEPPLEFKTVAGLIPDSVRRAGMTRA